MKPAVKKNPTNLEAIVRAAFADTPELIDISYCESHFRQFKDGKVLRGEINPQDVGLTQINEKYHLQTSQKLGYNIYTVEGNIAYAKWLYAQEGSQPWIWSRPCWSQKPATR